MVDKIKTADSDYIKLTIQKIMQQTAADNEIELLVISDDMVLLESGLDSMGFASVIIQLEEVFGEDPFLASEEIIYPKTFKELADFYIAYFCK